MCLPLGSYTWDTKSDIGSGLGIYDRDRDSGTQRLEWYSGAVGDRMGRET